MGTRNKKSMTSKHEGEKPLGQKPVNEGGVINRPASIKVEKVKDLDNIQRLLDIQHAATYLGRSVWGMRRLAYARKIRVVKEPGARKIYFDRLDLDAFISENKGLYT